MTTIITGDDPVCIAAACGCIEGETLIITDSATRNLLPDLGVPVRQTDVLPQPGAFENLSCSEPVTFILCFRNMRDQSSALEGISRASFHNASLIVVQQGSAGTFSAVDGTATISVSDLVCESARTSIKKLENMRRLDRLNELNRAAGSMLILMQHDPDPDALASGLALRTLLGRNRESAPLGTFGEVTRSENINMIRILDIPVLKVTPETLGNYSCIAMVDVQPPYFIDAPVRADIIFDHHPYSKNYAAQFTDIRTEYGATSTILGQYLIDSGSPISQRLATALVYGIKTDTMSLERDITHADLEVFTRLYPSANIGMIRQIESASLDMGEIKIFIKALRRLTMIGTMACTWLGRIRNDAMIPRLADFSIQVAGAEWSFAAGISHGNVVCSSRNVGYVQHAGKLMHSVFGCIGSAGGHRSTAKAVIPLAKFKQRYGVSTSDGIARALFAAIEEAIR